MKRIRLVIASMALLLMPVLAKATVPIVPLPVSVSVEEGKTFRINRALTASVQGGDSVKRVADTLFSMLPGKVKMKSKGGVIRFVTNADLGPEAYSIDITAKNITIAASRPAGFFYAVQTISQLLAQNK